MPELPEVETLCRELIQKVKNRTIKSVDVKVRKMINYSVKGFNQRLKNKKVIAVQRRGKMIIVKLTGDLFLLIHLKMTGQLVWQDKKGRAVSGGHQLADLGELSNKLAPHQDAGFSRLVFNFTDGGQLFFNDLRKFGWAKLADQRLANQLISKFGTEPLSQRFTLEKFHEILAKRPKAKIKPVLMNQELIAGIGNIYADESCFYAKIKPTRIIRTLTHEEIKKLHQGIIKILKQAINKKGTSVDTYVQLDGSAGSFVPYLKVYGRAGEKCHRCGGRISKIKLAGRGTHFCPQCQK